MTLLALLLASTAPATAGTFRDVTAEVGLDGLANAAAAWGDHDRDGWPDLYVAGQLWRNEGGRFTRLDGPAFDGSGLFADVDNDGDLDLYTFGTAARLYLNRPGEAEPWQEVAGAFPDAGIVVSRGAALGDLDGDALVDVYVGAYEKPEYEPDAMYLGAGDGSFSLAWQEPAWGPYDPYVKPGRGVTACDFDEDGDLDVYVSNYRLEQNALWRNDGAAGLEEVAAALDAGGIDDGWSYSFGHTIGSSWGDLDGDGRFDLFVGNFSHPEAHQDRPQFLLNLGESGDWGFLDRSDLAALAWQESFATPALGDYDNDGDLDLYFTTVYSGDYPVLYRNDGRWRFTDVTAEAGLDGLPATYQAAWADFDLDGDLDLATGGMLFENSGDGRRWLRVSLAGDGVTSDAAAIGAQVRVAVGDVVVTRQVEAGTGEHNQNDLALHLGLGDEDGPVDVHVTWLGGVEQTVRDVPVDGVVEVAQCADADCDGDDGVPPEDTAPTLDTGEPVQSADPAVGGSACGCAAAPGPLGAACGLVAAAAGARRRRRRQSA